MNTTLTTDDIEEINHTKPGIQLAEARKIKGYSKEYVAGKLHLRVRIIELLESDDYHNMPEPVFIKGYLRAYAMLLDIHPAPLLETFNSIYKSDKKNQKVPLWQSRKESNRAESAVKWLTVLFAIGATIAVSLWWHKNKDTERFFSANNRVSASDNKSESEIRLTDLSKMRSILSPQNKLSSLEQPSE